ncbi:C2 domain protein isoform 2 [Scophthalmus maximus]|uniref:C2 domain protein isoform 2 n=1 Tax=Scophthalmus maximus TaxID=52904 RepID=A0A2U9BR14_SCOMX|nr:C2 domain protein isoform 2 [Scophthalmus maximus]
MPRGRLHAIPRNAPAAVSGEAMASSLPLLLLVLCSLTVAEAQLKLFNLRASNLPSNILGTTDGYVKVFCGPAVLGETSVRNNNPNPWWAEEFSHFKAQENDILRLEVHDSDIIFNDLLGVCQRRIKVGTHEHDCFLEKGGTLHYSYTLGGQQACLDV